MTPETLGLFAAILFLLIALVGGGFTLQEVTIPAVPMWARVVAAALGVLFAVPFALTFAAGLDVPATGGEGAPAEARTDDGPPPTEVGDGPSGIIHHDETMAESPEQLVLTELTATGEGSETTVGDVIEIDFTLRNVGPSPFELSAVFVGARDPNEGNQDFGESHVGRVLQPGEEVRVTASKLVADAGVWTFFPCYAFDTGEGTAYCPDEWRGFELLVGA